MYILFTLFTINSCPKALNNSDFPYQCHVWIYRIITNCENDTTATKKIPKKLNPWWVKYWQNQSTTKTGLPKYADTSGHLLQIKNESLIIASGWQVMKQFSTTIMDESLCKLSRRKEIICAVELCCTHMGKHVLSSSSCLDRRLRYHSVPEH